MDAITQIEATDCLAALMAIDDGLTYWETSFIDDVSKQDGDFTDKQKQKIIEVYDRIV